jgi:ribosomal peptide maturation radical SAM protein 1
MKPAVDLYYAPWGRLDMPSLACGSAKAHLESLGYVVRVRYLNLEFAARVGAARYEWISEEIPFLGDALWAGFLKKGAAREDWAELLALWLRRKKARLSQARLAKLRKEAEAVRGEMAGFLEDLGSGGPPGGLSVFICERDKWDQVLASAVLARALKKKNPSCRLALWGPAVEEPAASAYLEAFSWIDFVLQGDPEPALASLLEYIGGVGGEPPPGVLVRGKSGGEHALVRDLDGLPEPDFGDYFEALRRLRKERRMFVPDIKIPFESSRGCWWGEKSHCRFCSLNEASIAVRSKSVKRLVEELSAQSNRYKTLRFCAKDEMLPPGHLADLGAALGEVDFSIFYELKPALNRPQVAALARAGIKEIQPGIETFHSGLLRKTGKGVRAVSNILFLKWCTYYGIDVRYYFLHGFPGETAEDNRSLLRTVGLLTHLNPPLAFRRLELLRHSPYHADAASHGFRAVRPYPEYERVLPSSVLDWGRAAQHFDYRLERGRALESATRDLAAEVERWKAAWLTGRPPALEVRRGEGFSEVYDGRSSQWKRIVLDGVLAWAYDYCGDHFRTTDEILRAAAEAGLSLSRPQWEKMASELSGQGILYREDQYHLSLALPYRRSARRHDLTKLYWGGAQSEKRFVQG